MNLFRFLGLIGLIALTASCDILNPDPMNQMADTDPALDYITQGEGTWAIKRVTATESTRVSVNATPTVTLDTTYTPDHQIQFSSKKTSGRHQGTHLDENGVSTDFTWELVPENSTQVNILFYDLPVFPYNREVALRVSNWEFEEMYFEGRSEGLNSGQYRIDFQLIE